MSLGISRTPFPLNEPVKTYAPGSAERDLLKRELDRQKQNPIEIPIVIGGREIKSGEIEEIRSPHDRNLKLGVYHKASAEHIQMALAESKAAGKAWAELPWEDRAAVFLKAADLLAEKYRYTLNAATMLGQSKNVQQAEIDSACELIDFWRFNVHYMFELYQQQPMAQSRGIWNRLEYRPLEGFVWAVTPFNFTAIGGNLPTAPAMLGNVVMWKPASTQMLSAYYTMQILKEAGLPDGVINLVPGRGTEVAPVLLNHPDLAGIHFTGSTGVFQGIWKTVGENVSQGLYKSYPRLVGETGGKDFIVAYKDADIKSLAVNMVRGAYEYQGQKCSAASRAYIPSSIWPQVKREMISMMEQIQIGDVCDFKTFMGAVIDKKAYQSIVNYIEYAKKSPEATIAFGGRYEDSKGYFIWPTLVETTNPHFKLIEEEIFGPVLTVYIYEDSKFDETLELVDKTGIYALTGAIFAQDRGVINKMTVALRNAAGNFYVNDKPTGAVVGQQPFGGARGSGTNDKAGSYLNLVRWLSVRSIKENFIPVTDFTYPHMK